MLLRNIFHQWVISRFDGEKLKSPWYLLKSSWKSFFYSIENGLLSEKSIKILIYTKTIKNDNFSTIANSLIFRLAKHEIKGKRIQDILNHAHKKKLIFNCQITALIVQKYYFLRKEPFKFLLYFYFLWHQFESILLHNTHSYRQLWCLFNYVDMWI